MTDAMGVGIPTTVKMTLRSMKTGSCVKGDAATGFMRHAPKNLGF